jgi:hypothetical protein
MNRNGLIESLERRELFSVTDLVIDPFQSLAPADGAATGTPTLDARLHSPAPRGQAVTVAALDLNLLGVVARTGPTTVNVTAQSGDGKLLGNVLTTAFDAPNVAPRTGSQGPGSQGPVMQGPGAQPQSFSFGVSQTATLADRFRRQPGQTWTDYTGFDPEL